MVDSPGYGYMKKSLQIKKSVIKIINNFLQYNNYIKILFHIMDFKIGPTLLDLDIYQILKKSKFNPIIIFNKKDKVLLNHMKNRLEKIKKIFHELGYTDIPMYLISCKTKEGLNNIVDFIYSMLLI